MKCPHCSKELEGVRPIKSRAVLHAEKARRAALPDIVCSCGAKWTGRYTENNPIIAIHRQRSTCKISEIPKAVAV